MFFVEEGFDDEAGGEDFVARGVEEVGARDVGHADGFAFAAAQAVFDFVVERAQFGFFEDEGVLLQ